MHQEPYTLKIKSFSFTDSGSWFSFAHWNVCAAVEPLTSGCDSHLSLRGKKQKDRSILRQPHLTATTLVGREDTCSVHSHWLCCSVDWNVTRDWDSQLDPSIHRADLLSLSLILLYIWVKALFKPCLEQWSNISLHNCPPLTKPKKKKSCTTWRWISGRKNLSELEAFLGERILWTCMKESVCELQQNVRSLHSQWRSQLQSQITPWIMKSGGFTAV